MNLPSQLVSVVVVHLCGYGDLQEPGKEVKQANNRMSTSIEIILHLFSDSYYKKYVSAVFVDYVVSQRDEVTSHVYFYYTEILS